MQCTRPSGETILGNISKHYCQQFLFSAFSLFYQNVKRHLYLFHLPSIKNGIEKEHEEKKNKTKSEVKEEER
jgi:hypothetical protein